MKPRRVGNPAGEDAANAGIMASSQGTATAAPRPRRTVRREIGRLLMRSPSLILYVSAPPQAERIAFYNLDHHPRELVAVLADRRQRPVDRPVVVRLDPAAERVDQHLLDQAAREVVLLRQDRLLEVAHALDRRPVGE